MGTNKDARNFSFADPIRHGKSAPSPDTAIEGTKNSAEQAKPALAGKTNLKESEKSAQKPTSEIHERLGFETSEDLLLWVPKGMRDYRYVFNGHLPTCETPRIFDFELAEKASQDRGSNKIAFHGFSVGQQFHVNLFGRLFGHPVSKMIPGTRMYIYGTPKQFGSRWYISGAEIIPEHFVGRAAAQYESVRGKAKGDILARIISHMIDFQGDKLFDLIRSRIAQSFRNAGDDQIFQMCSITEQMLYCPKPDGSRVLRNDLRAIVYSLHKPQSEEELLWAQGICRRIAAGQIKCHAYWTSIKPHLPESSIPIKNDDLSMCMNSVGYKPTSAQLTAITEIISDLRSEYPMQRLLSGDVGYGKTMTYGIPLASAAMAGASCAILIQNSLLVDQVALEMRKWFPKLPIIQYDSASTWVCKDTQGKELWKKKLGTKEFSEYVQKNKPIMIGTTGICGTIEKLNIELDFLVIDEQQKLSIAQRDRLNSAKTNVLQATATCVPRSAALIAYGGADQSILDVSPVKKEIETLIVTPSTKFSRVDMFREIKQGCLAGEKTLVIYSRLQESDDSDSISIERASTMWQKVLGMPVAMLHGQQKPKEKSENMDLFVSGKTPLMVASTVIEIGVSIPSIIRLVVVEADRYGVSTIHQMRGRLVRNGGKGKCYLFCSTEPELETLERLELICKYNDGFILAEKDMQARGFGDVSIGSDDQKGKSQTLFPNIKLMPSDLDAIELNQSLL